MRDSSSPRVQARSIATPRIAASAFLAVLLAPPLVGALGGCKDKPVRYTVHVKGMIPHSSNPALVYRDKASPFRRDGETMVADIEVPADVALSGDIKELRVRVDTPCGPATAGVQLAPGDKDTLAKDEKDRTTTTRPVHAYVSVDLPIAGINPVVVHVDRRDGGDAPIKIGDQLLEKDKALPARQGSPLHVGEAYEIVRPGCATGMEVRAGDEKIGELRFHNTSVAPFEQALIDVKGGHCYDSVRYFYGESRALTGRDGRPPEETHVQSTRVNKYSFGPPDKAFLPECPEKLDRQTCWMFKPVACRG